MSGASDQTIHQAVHGYQRGHRLLATSVELDDTAASVMARTSDSAPNYRGIDGPYLTGYPLFDGRYVFAKTWPVADAERPNTVWTHSLLLPPDVGVAELGEFLIGVFMSPADFDPALPLRSIASRTTYGSPRSVDNAAAYQAVCYYQSGSAVVLESDASRRESLVLAVWDQLWSSARRSARFCSAPDAGRFVGERGSLTFTVHPERATVNGGVGPPWDLVADDLVSPGEFRAFLHFVASGHRDVALMEVCARFFQLALRRDDAAVHDAESLMSRVAPSPKSFRRLKRRLMGFEGQTARWDVKPLTLLRALAIEQLGEMVSADDAAVASWLQASWDQDPASTSAVLADARNRRSHDDSRDAEDSTVVLTAKAALGPSFSSTVDSLLAVETLEMVATLDSVQAMRLVWERQSTELWEAWAALPHSQRQEMLKVSTTPTEAHYAAASRSLLKTTAALEDAIEAYPELLDHAVSAAAVLSRSLPLSGLSNAARRHVRDALASATDPSQIRILATLADPFDLPNAIQYEAWEGLLREEESAPAAIAYLVGRKSRSPEGLRSTAVAAGRLYALLASSPAEDTWGRLSRSLRNGSSWDRCGQLIEDFARNLKGVDDTVISATLGTLKVENYSAAVALAAVLEDRKGGRSAWDLFNPFRW